VDVFHAYLLIVITVLVSALAGLFIATIRYLGRRCHRCEQ
jgi:hypothetical protein